MANVCEMFGVSDPEYISKPRLTRAVESLVDELHSLRVELFCENPDHTYFSGVPESVLAPMRLERIKRRQG